MTFFQEVQKFLDKASEFGVIYISLNTKTGSSPNSLDSIGSLFVEVFKKLPQMSVLWDDDETIPMEWTKSQSLKDVRILTKRRLPSQSVLCKLNYKK